MATAYSPTNFVNPLSINTRSHDKPLFDPLKTTTSFLGSTHKLRPTSLQFNQPNSLRRSAVVAVSDVVKEKKVKSSSNLVTNFTLFIQCHSHYSLYIFLVVLLCFWLPRELRNGIDFLCFWKISIFFSCIIEICWLIKLKKYSQCMIYDIEILIFVSL